MSSLLASIRSIALMGGVLLATLLMAAACETAPPVQEMSDARQAIAVAREVGAETHATEELSEAERHLQSAEQQLNARHYSDARRYALEAKARAQDAIKISEGAQPDGT